MIRKEASRQRLELSTSRNRTKSLIVKYSEARLNVNRESLRLWTPCLVTLHSVHCDTYYSSLGTFRNQNFTDHACYKLQPSVIRFCGQRTWKPASGTSTGIFVNSLQLVRNGWHIASVSIEREVESSTQFLSPEWDTRHERRRKLKLLNLFLMSPFRNLYDSYIWSTSLRKFK